MGVAADIGFSRFPVRVFQRFDAASSGFVYTAIKGLQVVK